MKSAASNHLFVYSSLRRGFQHGAYDYVKQYFNYISDGRVKGFLNDMGDKPVATPTSENAFIIGELFELNTDDASYVFGQLDDYEGLITECGEMPMYKRELTTVYKEDGNTTEAWVYWYNGDVSGTPVIASGNVLDYMRSR
ncbi:MAG: gamma-glutamylcyclotransferase family protein [Ginsengibacter sp.]